MKSIKTLNLKLLVETDAQGGYLVSLPGVLGAHAHGATMQEALKNIDEVLNLLKDYHGAKNIKKALARKSGISSVLPYTLEYA